MHVYLHLFGLTIPSYGLLIASGVVIGNIIAFFVLKHEKLDFRRLPGSKAIVSSGLL